MSMMLDKEITHKPLKEEIFEYLHRQIIAGKYAPGDWLRQEDIASQMKVSMTPVREALDLLVAAGLAERVPYRGVRVREMVTKDIVEAYGMRLMLEALVAQEAAKHITSSQLEVLEKMIIEMKNHETLDEMSNARHLARDFHSAIAEASGNDLLIKLYAIVSNAFPDWLLYEALFRNPDILADSMADTHKEHVAIVDALKKRDGEKAIQRSLEHVMESGKWLEEYLKIPAAMLREKEEFAYTLTNKKNKK
jgi:DNA-binding GntR family transcriptional regulator